jgi:hypothetical protein
MYKHTKNNSMTDKYLRIREWGVLLEADRAGKSIRKRFLFRRYGGLESTLTAARKYRDQWHLNTYSDPISTGFRHVVKRSGSQDKDLPGGVSIGKVKGREAYVVVSGSDESGKQYKVRFSISEHGRDEAIRLGIQYRKDKLKT